MIPADFQPSSFTAVSLDEWWMLGTADCLVGSGTCGAIVRTTDGGSSFVGIPSPPASASAVTQLRFANSLDGYAFDTELWQTMNGGDTWTRVATRGTVTDVEAADDEAYALECATAKCASIELLRSDVGSSAWQMVTTPAPLGYGASLAVSGPNVYVTGTATLLYSSDRGTSFVKRADRCIRTLPCRVIAAADETPTLWAAAPTGTEAGAWMSNNGGTTWRSASPLKAGFPNSLGITAASSSVALVWPGPLDDLPTVMARTTNGGKSYAAVLSKSGRVLWAGFSDPARAYAIVEADATRLFESNDGGAQWQPVVIKS